MSAETCNHCGGTGKRGRRFPLQTSDYTGAESDQRSSVPWAIGARAWEVYHVKHKQQSCERIAQRGGFSNGEMSDLLPGWRELADAIDSPS